jgi:hypothetical protein
VVVWLVVGFIKQIMEMGMLFSLKALGNGRGGVVNVTLTGPDGDDFTVGSSTFVP